MTNIFLDSLKNYKKRFLFFIYIFLNKFLARFSRIFLAFRLVIWLFGYLFFWETRETKTHYTKNIGWNINIRVHHLQPANRCEQVINQNEKLTLYYPVKCFMCHIRYLII